MTKHSQQYEVLSGISNNSKSVRKFSNTGIYSSFGQSDVYQNCQYVVQCLSDLKTHITRMHRNVSIASENLLTKLQTRRTNEQRFWSTVRLKGSFQSSWKRQVMTVDRIFFYFIVVTCYMSSCNFIYKLYMKAFSKNSKIYMMESKIRSFPFLFRVH